MADTDVLVVGAGMAGLAAADRLVARGRRVVIVEARDRLGGRIHTTHDPELASPVELGAEFVHGRPAELVALIEALGLTLVAVPERHRRGPGRPPLPDLRRSLARLLEAGDASHDRPVAELLDETRGMGEPGEVEAVARYLEGFHAADLSLLGSRSLAENENAGAEDGEDVHRIREGYGALIERFVARIDPARCEIRLGQRVTALHWRPREVRSAVRTGNGRTEVTARQAVVTLPLPVLCELVEATGPDAIDPAPPQWQTALRTLRMGSAHRAVLGFDRRWWAPDGENGPSFVHGGAEAFPVWWTALPSHEALLTGWTGGPRAAALSGQPEGVMLRAALESLASVFRRDVAELRSALRLAYTHDWTADPLSRGAYSYGGVGAIEARELLARPVGGTVVLAGEAVARKGRNATVHGALASGREAADTLFAS